MSVSVELLDAFKSAMGGISDYRAAKLIGVTQPTMSNYRTGKILLSPEKICLLCELAGFDAVDWLMRHYHAVAKCDKVRNVIEQAQARLAA